MLDCQDAVLLLYMLNFPLGNIPKNVASFKEKNGKMIYIYIILSYEDIYCNCANVFLLTG